MATPRKRVRDPEYMKAQRTKYNHSEKGRAARRRYMQTDKGKSTLRRSEQRNRWPRELMQRYGLTVEAYAWLLYSQNFACAICERPFSRDVIAPEDPRSGKERPNVDHDHETGAVRGVTCGWCNYGVLGAMENAGPEQVRRVLRYLGWENE